MLNLPIIKVIIRLSCLLTVMGLFGCGGGSSSSNTNTGVFVDSAVEGLNYKTDTLSGITGPNGEFQYKTGETVTFSIGDVVIGSVVGDAIISPLHLGTIFNEADPATINISRLLQSLDSDGNLDNGIQITTEIREEMHGRSFTFNKPTAEFEDDNIVSLFNALNAKNVFKYSGQGKLRNSLEAQAHLRQTLAFFGYQRTFPIFHNVTSIRKPFHNFSTFIRPPSYPNITTIRRIIPIHPILSTVHRPVPIHRILSAVRRPVPIRTVYPVVSPRIVPIRILNPAGVPPSKS